MLLNYGVGEDTLDWKEIQPVHPKGNQSWMFIGTTDAEAETPILWPPDAKNWLILEDSVAGKDWRLEEMEMTEDEITGWHRRLNWHEFEQALRVGDEQGNLVCCSQSLGWQRVGHNWATELNWTEHQRNQCSMQWLDLLQNFIHIQTSVASQNVPQSIGQKKSSQIKLPVQVRCTILDAWG